MGSGGSGGSSGSSASGSSSGGGVSGWGGGTGDGEASSGLTDCQGLVNVLELESRSAVISISEDEPLLFSTRWVLFAVFCIFLFFCFFV